MLEVTDDEGETATPHLSTKVKNRLKAQAAMWQHQMTHTPYNRFCKICVLANARRKSNFRRKGYGPRKPKQFGESVTADHFFGRNKKWKSECEKTMGNGDGLVVYDIATDFGYCYPCVNQTAQTAAEGFAHFKGKQNFV